MSGLSVKQVFKESKFDDGFLILQVRCILENGRTFTHQKRFSPERLKGMGMVNHDYIYDQLLSDVNKFLSGGASA